MKYIGGQLATEPGLCASKFESNIIPNLREGQFLIPQIAVRARRFAKSELPPSVKPTRDAIVDHLIEVIDNGIGFNEKYVDRIFQVFQRLHSKNEFAGTGVGLAIVQKVVTNHGGAITASGQPNQGATFCVYLPA